MDLHNLWNDDPEEILLDLGFGCDEPDLSGRIPTRFLNFQSYARGITIQVFLEAQKDRLNLENPDVSNRFRQLEVLQLVTKGFSSFMGSSSSLLKGKDLPLDVQERRSRISALFRQASKKTLHNLKNQHTQRIEGYGVIGGSTGETEDPAAQSLTPNESYQSGSGGSLEEPFTTTIPQLARPGPDHVKVVSGLSVWTTDNQSSGNPGTSPSTLFRSLSLTSSVVEHLPSSSSSSPESSPSYTLKSDLQTLNNKTPTIRIQPPPISPSEPESHVQFTALPSVVSDNKPAWWISEEFQKAQAVSHDSEDRTGLTFSLFSLPDSSPSPNFHQCQLDLTGTSWSKQCAETFISASAWLSSPCLSSPYLHPSSHGCLCPPSLVPQTLIKSLSDSPGDGQEDVCSLPPDGLSDDSCQLNVNNPFAPSSVFPDVSTLEDGNPTMISAASTPPAHPESLKRPADGRLSDLTDHLQQAGRPLPQQEIISCDNSGSPPASSVDNIHLKMAPMSLNEDGTLQKSWNKHEGQADVQTSTHADIRAAAQTSSLLDEHSVKTKQREFRGNSDMEVNSTQIDSLLSSSVSQFHGRRTGEASPGTPEGLVVVLETSVDDSDGEHGDVDAFRQQLDTDEQVYWAEPVRVSSMSQELSSPEGSDGFQFPCIPASDSLPSPAEALTSPRSSSAASAPDQTTGERTPPFPSPNPKQPIPSVSVSMSSVLSSHIVSRKDVPYRTKSHLNNLQRNLHLDTSTPLRAVQSWADLRMQHINLTKKSLHRSVQTIPSSWTRSGSFLVPPPGPLWSQQRWSHEYISRTGGNSETVSGLWTDVQEDADTNDNADQDRLWEANQTVNMACCCHCGHQCPQKSHSRQRSGHVPYSLDELEEMMLCLQQFCLVFSDIEERSCEEQAAVYGILSATEREDVETLKKLRSAVKLEAGELEMQLRELVHHDDESLKTKMHTLLDEQHLLRSQVLLPWTVPTSSLFPNGTVSSSNRLLQDGHVSTGIMHSRTSATQAPPASMSEGQGPSSPATDKLDFLSLLQRVGKSCIH